MPTTRLDLFNIIVAQEAAFERLLTASASEMYNILYNNDDHNGEIPIERQERVRQQIIGALIGLFMTSDMRMFSFDTNEIRPLTPFARVLSNSIRQSTEVGVGQQRSFMERGLRNQDELRANLLNNRSDPRGLIDNYANTYTMIRSSGRTIEDSVLLAAVEIRRKLNNVLTELFGMSAKVKDMVKRIGAFMNPKLTWDEGGGGVFPAVRMVRSEPLLAYSLAARNSGQLNPFIDVVYVRRSSPNAIPCPVCDPVVAGSPYTIGTISLVGFHPECLCQYTFKLVSNKVGIDKLRQGGYLDVRSPLQPNFGTWLLNNW